MSNINISDPSTYSNAFNSKSALILNRNSKILEFWLKSLSIPGISIDSTDITREPYPIKIENNILTYSDLDISIFIDENFEVYKELYDWFVQVISIEGNERPQTNGTILIFNNQMTEVVLSLSFEGLFLTGLPSISYDNYSSTHISVNVSMMYNKFTPDFKKIT